MKIKPYVDSWIHASRRQTHEVKIGSLAIGANNPLLVQSMLTTSTLDTEGSVAQIQKLVDVGCPLIRITTPTLQELENVLEIKKSLRKLNVHVPLVADVHFQPKIAFRACEIFDKVRINPGNFADRKRFDVREYTDQEYDEEIARIRDAFVPLLHQAKKNGVALRIGTNHGSLSDRIMNRYGDTPLGMVESAFEFLRIARDESFHQIVLSMKASNPSVMIQAYRLLVSRMKEEGWTYPLHLGVTEAGNGEDGRIKSAVGIGSLLADGIGDTIRVSLTEDPEFEIPVAKRLVALYSRVFQDNVGRASDDVTSSTSSNNENPATNQDKYAADENSFWNPYSYARRQSSQASTPILVAIEFLRSKYSAALTECTLYDPQPDLFGAVVLSPKDAINQSSLLNEGGSNMYLRVVPGATADLRSIIQKYAKIVLPVNAAWLASNYIDSLSAILKNKDVVLALSSFEQIEISWDLYAKLKQIIDSNRISFEVSGTHIVHLTRAWILSQNETRNAVVTLRIVRDARDDDETFVLRAASELGGLLCDGIGDNIVVSTENLKDAHGIAFGVLQATRLRMSRADFIACPSCGRTLFDLQSTTARIKSATSHLKGVKIAIMGCIVNGPGEMADADFGYVGAGPGHIHLYVGKELVQRHVPQDHADQELISLIKKHGRWIDPVV